MLTNNTKCLVCHSYTNGITTNASKCCPNGTICELYYFTNVIDNVCYTQHTLSERNLEIIVKILHNLWTVCYNSFDYREAHRFINSEISNKLRFEGVEVVNKNVDKIVTKDI